MFLVLGQVFAGLGQEVSGFGQVLLVVLNKFLRARTSVFFLV